MNATRIGALRHGTVARGKRKKAALEAKRRRHIAECVRNARAHQEWLRKQQEGKQQSLSQRIFGPSRTTITMGY